MKKTAIVTGITGQDGSYLADLLLEKDYTVYGLVRRTSQGSLGQAKHLEGSVELVDGDIGDGSSLLRLCKLAHAGEFYNMAAQSHVGDSFNQPEYTADVTGVGVVRCLEAIRASGYHTKFLQASTSELFGGGEAGEEARLIGADPAQFNPKSPYAAAKMYGFWITKLYRDSYRMYTVNAISYNHESERRGPHFVTRKITQAVARIKKGLQTKLKLGNLNAARDWGYAPDYVKGMWLMLNVAAQPDDYVLATGETHTVRDFCDAAFSCVGLDYQDYVEIDPAFYRPNEVPALLGDYSETTAKTGWKPKVTFNELVKLMVQHDLKQIEN